MRFAIIACIVASASAASLRAPDPVHPIACAADVAKLAADSAALAPFVSDITAKCDKTVSDDCVVSLNGLFSAIDTTIADATKAFGDCSDGTDSACNSDFEKILSDLEETNSGLRMALEDCVHMTRGDLRVCVKDALAAVKVIGELAKDAVNAITDCKTQAF